MPSKRARTNSTTVSAVPIITTPAVNDTPFTFELVGFMKNAHRGLLDNDRYCISATIAVPTEDEECPLTLEAISQSKLAFLPEAQFLVDRPLHSKLTLPCGHSFSALTLVYNFCKNSMVCPCCRAGKDVRLDVECLPRHLRSDFKAHIQKVTQQEARDDDESIIQDLITTTGFVSVMPYQVLVANNNLSLQMEFFNMWEPIRQSSGIIPIFTMNTGLRMSGSLLAPRSDLRAISNLAHMGVNAVRLSVLLTMRGTGSVAIDATGITQLPEAGNARSMRIPGITNVAITQNNGYEVVIQLRNGNNNNINNINNSEAPATQFSILFAQPDGPARS